MIHSSLPPGPPLHPALRSSQPLTCSLEMVAQSSVTSTCAWAWPSTIRMLLDTCKPQEGMGARRGGRLKDVSQGSAGRHGSQRSSAEADAAGGRHTTLCQHTVNRLILRTWPSVVRSRRPLTKRALVSLCSTSSATCGGWDWWGAGGRGC